MMGNNKGGHNGRPLSHGTTGRQQSGQDQYSNSKSVSMPRGGEAMRKMIKPGSPEDRAMEKKMGIKPGSAVDKKMESGGGM